MTRFLSPLLVIITVILNGCTRNNGDIGEWFGTWKVTEITIDGAVDTTYQGNMFWMFQTSVICMRTIDDNHGYSDHWGTWRELPDGALELNFTHHDNDNETGSWKYRPAPASHLPAAVNTLHILRLTGSTATLTYTLSTLPSPPSTLPSPPSTLPSPPSTTYTYHLQKW